ncbi:MAG: saccharopine dehydrogenase NADP-binding domain-containing protein, partial [Gaiellaceae bacterium]
MRILVVGAGGVGSAIAAIAQHRSFYDHITVADIDAQRGARAIDRLAEPDRFSSTRIDASDQSAVRDLAHGMRADVIVNATDPRFNMPIFDAAFDARCTYLDMALSLSKPHAKRPYHEVGVKLGDAQFAADGRWRDAGLLALV